MKHFHFHIGTLVTVTARHKRSRRDGDGNGQAQKIGDIQEVSAKSHALDSAWILCLASSPHQFSHQAVRHRRLDSPLPFVPTANRSKDRIRIDRPRSTAVCRILQRKSTRCTRTRIRMTGNAISLLSDCYQFQAAKRKRCAFSSTPNGSQRSGGAPSEIPCSA